MDYISSYERHKRWNASVRRKWSSEVWSLRFTSLGLKRIDFLKFSFQGNGRQRFDLYATQHRIQTNRFPRWLEANMKRCVSVIIKACSILTEFRKEITNEACKVEHKVQFIDCSFQEKHPIANTVACLNDLPGVNVHSKRFPSNKAKMPSANKLSMVSLFLFNFVLTSNWIDQNIW